MTFNALFKKIGRQPYSLGAQQVTVLLTSDDAEFLAKRNGIRIPLKLVFKHDKANGGTMLYFCLDGDAMKGIEAKLPLVVLPGDGNPFYSVLIDGNRYNILPDRGGFLPKLEVNSSMPGHNYRCYAMRHPDARMSHLDLGVHATIQEAVDSWNDWTLHGLQRAGFSKTPKQGESKENKGNFP